MQMQTMSPEEQAVWARVLGCGTAPGGVQPEQLLAMLRAALTDCAGYQLLARRCGGEPVFAALARDEACAVRQLARLYHDRTGQWPEVTGQEVSEPPTPADCRESEEQAAAVYLEAADRTTAAEKTAFETLARDALARLRALEEAE